MNEKVDKYFELLHPEYATLTPGEQFKLMRDQAFIEDHIDEIDAECSELMAHDGATEVDTQVIQDAIRNVKSSVYKAMLYPDGLQAAQQDRQAVARHLAFMRDHIDEIDKQYTEYVHQAERKGEDINSREIINTILESMQQKEQITPQQIGKRTRNASIELKQQVESVEAKEIDITKEGGKQVGY